MDERERVLLTLAGMRALMGIVWLSLLFGKFPPGFGRHTRDGLMHTFRLAEQHAAIGPLRDLVRRLVIPHFTLFGWIVFLVELVIGILLLAGFYTRIAAWIPSPFAAVQVTAVVDDALPIASVSLIAEAS